MERNDSGTDDQRRDSANVPAPSRNLTPAELEAVIRRASELQAGTSARAEEGVSEVEVVRIGQELGLEPAAVRRAIAEVRGRPPEEQGALARVAGAGTVRASRVVPLEAVTARGRLDRYLREREFMVAQRRFPDRTRYVRDSSIAAGLGRLARGFARAHKPLNMQQLDVAVSALEADSCLVEVSTDLGGTRGGVVAGVLGSGSALAGGWAATVWATPIPDPLMLLAVPTVAGAWYGMRAIYRTICRSAEDRLESLLDRLEHHELR